MRTMIIRTAPLFLFLSTVRFAEVYGLSKDFVSDVDARYSLWPSIHHGIRVMRLRKRELAAQSTIKPEVLPGHTVAQVNAIDEFQGLSEGQAGAQNAAHNPVTTIQPPKPTDIPQSVSIKPSETPSSTIKDDKKGEKSPMLNNKTVNKPETKNATSDTSTSTVDNKTITHNTTVTEPTKINLSDPGVMKRAAIVFGGFALLATAYYFIIYRKKANVNDAKNTNSSLDPNQFRYGVLESEDKRSNMELSRVPLTMESDEDDDEDLEIFDLGQKNKSLSYINLQQHDEDIVLNDSRSIDVENLLVDIEDTNSETLINWSGNGSKAVL